MLVEEFTVNNEVGLHARPAANFVQTASKFKSKITLIKDGKEVDAKSIIGILSLGVGRGTNIKVKTEGEDEQDAIAAIRLLAEHNFGDE
jgi:phosphocarrier protein